MGGGHSHLAWVPASNGYIPPNAVAAGSGRFVARAHFGGEMIPGKVAHGHGHCFVAYGGQEHKIHSYEVLVDNGGHFFGGACYYWANSQNGQVPPNAYFGGYTSHNEPLYIGRGYVNGEACVGKVFPPHGCAYFPFGGSEHKHYNYEVLCCK